MTAHRTTSVFAGSRFPPEVISAAIRWYLRYGLSYKDVEELSASPPRDYVPSRSRDAPRREPSSYSWLVAAGGAAWQTKTCPDLDA